MAVVAIIAAGDFIEIVADLDNMVSRAGWLDGLGSSGSGGRLRRRGRRLGRGSNRA